MKSKKVEALDRLNSRIVSYRCPLCEQQLTVEEETLRCATGHTFDVAKQGYVYFAGDTKKSMYDATLFEARQAVLTNTALYDTVQQTIDEQLTKYNVRTIVDAGCGEGTHTAALRSDGRYIAGVDLSKDGVQLAAKTYRNIEWFVADLAHLPYEDDTFDAVVNILSPANERSFRRILKEDGIVIKVVPNAHYLTEVRQAFTGEAAYDAKETHDHIASKYHIVEKVEIKEEIPFTETDWANLVQMTPLSWHADALTVMEFLEEVGKTVTLDVVVYVLRVKPFANESGI